jgi:hypothetical protein
MFTPLYFAVLNHHKEPQMIQPTVGRVVHYFRDRDSEEQVALIAHVNQDGTVNLAVFDHNGSPEPRSACIPLVQEGEALPLQGHYCRWMPYQLGQAAKTEAMEARVSDQAYAGLRTGEVSFQNENTGFGGVFAAPPVADPIPVLTEVVGQGGTFDGGGASGDWLNPIPAEQPDWIKNAVQPDPTPAPAQDASPSSSEPSYSSSSSDSSSSSSSDSGSSSSSSD